MPILIEMELEVKIPESASITPGLPWMASRLIEPGLVHAGSFRGRGEATLLELQSTGMPRYIDG